MRRNLEETRAYADKDRFAVYCDIVIDEVGEGYAKCHMDIKDHHRNARGVVMGGATFTLADLCYGAACDFSAVSMTSEINYLAPATGDVLYAEAHVVKDGHATVFYEVVVTDQNGRKVAFLTMTDFKSK